MTNDRELFYRELNKLILDPKINRLSNFPQHNGSNTLAHCVQVAKRSFELAEILGWDIDETWNVPSPDSDEKGAGGL